MKIKIFADGANLKDIIDIYKMNKVSGFTTNPTLMRKSGVTDYLSFAREVCSEIKDLPISFEVFSDDLKDMKRQAETLQALGSNIYVKIPVMNTKMQTTYSIINELSELGIQLNVTAVFTNQQIDEISASLAKNIKSIISIFAGRIANAGVDPMPIVKRAVNKNKHHENIEILWASPREPFNIIQAEDCNCHIITLTPEMIKAMDNFGKDLTAYSLETVKMFYDDAQAAGYTL